MPKVLIVEDDELIAKSMATHLHRSRFRPALGGERARPASHDCGTSGPTFASST